MGKKKDSGIEENVIPHELNKCAISKLNAVGARPTAAIFILCWMTLKHQFGVARRDHQSA